jgi:hypothetical protein
VPRGEVTSNPAEAYEIAKRLGGAVVVVKAQIHAGGRGKGGGVKLAKSPAQAVQLAKDMIGMTLITHQTGPEGRVVGRVLIEEGLRMTRELPRASCSIARGKPVIMASAAAAWTSKRSPRKPTKKSASIKPASASSRSKPASSGSRQPRRRAGQQVRQGRVGTYAYLATVRPAQDQPARRDRGGTSPRARRG